MYNKIDVITDIDDTIYPSNFGGSDVKFENHTVYPGVRAFYAQIKSEYVTLLTARPSSFYSDTKEEIEKAIGKPVKVLNGNLGDLNVGVGWDIMKRFFHIHTNSSYPSSIDHLSGKTPIKWYSVYKDMAATKFESIKNVVTPSIFIGDSGQGDLICAYKIYEYKKTNPLPIICFIHNIVKHKDYKGRTMAELVMIKEDFKESLREIGIHLFTNYIDLVRQLVSLGFEFDLARIREETLADFDRKKQFVYHQNQQLASIIEDDLIQK